MYTLSLSRCAERVYISVPSQLTTMSSVYLVIVKPNTSFNASDVVVGVYTTEKGAEDFLDAHTSSRKNENGVWILNNSVMCIQKVNADCAWKNPTNLMQIYF